MMNKFRKMVVPFSVLLILLSGCAASGAQTESPVEETPAAVEPAPELKTQHWCYAAADFIAGGVPSEKVWSDYIADKSVTNTMLLTLQLNQALNIMATQDESYHEDTVLDASDEAAREALFEGIRFAQGQIEMPAETWASLEEANTDCTDPALGLPQSGKSNWSKLMGFISDAK